MPEHALDHRNADDREHLLGRRERQGTQPRPLAADEDDRLHYFVVVVRGRRGGRGGRVVVVAGVVVVVAAGALVVVAVGAVVVVAPATVVVVVATGWVPASTCSRPRWSTPGGLGSAVPSGTKPTVISWRLANLRSAGFDGREAAGLYQLTVLGGLGRHHPRAGLHLADLAGVRRAGRALLTVLVLGNRGGRVLQASCWSA